MDNRKKALAEFLNDQPQKVKLGLYTWRGRYYQVLPYEDVQIRKYKTKVKKLQTRPDHFIKWEISGFTFGIREMTSLTLKKWYNITLDK